MSKDIIGINIGSKNTIIGTYKTGIFEIVVSETSARTIPTVVSYNDKERNIGELAMHTNRSNFKRTIVYPNRWLGIQRDWPFRAEEAKYSYTKPVEDKTGKLGFKINYKNAEGIYTPESLMGLFFSKLKNIWLKAEIKTNQVVVSIPDYCTAHERKAMNEAISIGGLQCSAILNESSAITLAYAFQKMKEFEDDKPRTVAFIDLGHASCNIFFSQFTKKKVKVVSVSSERFCGAREFDYLIAQKLSNEFEKKFGANPMEAPKTKIRLIDTITKVRKSLTVNKDITISVDSLMEGEDLVYNLSRDEFEKIIDPVVKKFENLCKRAIEQFEKETKLKLKDVHSFEMVGDTVRTPIILETIKKVMGKEVSKTLVPDMCIARGCALYAMMISPYFNVQNFEFDQYNPYAIKMEYPVIKDKKEVTKTLEIIKSGINIPASKTISFTQNQISNLDKIPIKFFYSDDPRLDWLPNKLLNSYNITMKKKKEKEWKFIIKYDLDNNCIPKLGGAKIQEKKKEMVPVVDTSKKEEKKPEDKKPEDKKEGEKKPEEKKPEEKKPEEKKPEEKKPEEKKPEDANKKEKEKKPEEKKEEKKPEEKKEEKKEDKKEEPPKMQEKLVETETVLNVDQVEILFGTPKGILENYKKTENFQTGEDKIFREASSFKNSLEQYIYSTKEKLDSKLKGYYIDSERQQLTQFMDKLMEWLYSEDEKLYDMATLKEKSKDMKQIGDEIYKRNELWNELENNFNIYNSTLNEIETQYKNEKDKFDKKQFTYVTAEDLQKIEELIKNSIDNAEKKRSSCAPAPKTQRPPVDPNDVKMLYDNLKINVKKIYDDAEFKVKEAERKKKEEEEKKRKEEEEKKKKEEEEKKKKEEEEKKKKEEEEKKKNGDKKDETKEEKKDEKKDPTSPDNDVTMKDCTKDNKENPPKVENKAENEKMDVD